MAYRELPDGTRVYSNGFKYKPVPDHLRKRKRYPKGTQWHGGKCYLPLSFLPEESRLMPATIPDSVGASHELGCLCPVCSTPRVQRLKRERIYGEIKRASSQP